MYKYIILSKLIVFHFSSDSNIYIYSTCHTLYSVPTLHVPCSVQSLLSRNEFVHHISLPLCPTSTGHIGLGGRVRRNFVRPFTHWGAPWRADQLILMSPLLPPSLTSLLRHLIGCVSAGCYDNVSGWRQWTGMSVERKL